MKTSSEKTSGETSRLRSKALNKPHDAFSDSNATEDAELRHLFQDIVQEVTYPDFKHLPVEQFTQLRRLATLDLFFEAKDVDKARWASVDLDELDQIRATKDFIKVSKAIREAFDTVSTPRAFKEHVGDIRNQDRLYRAMRRTAIHAVDPKWSTKAQAELVERVAPRAQPGQQAVIIQIQEAQAKLIAESLSQVKQIESDVIDGEYHHVQPTETPPAEGAGEE